MRTTLVCCVLATLVVAAALTWTADLWSVAAPWDPADASVAEAVLDSTDPPAPAKKAAVTAEATFGTGCFWCTEAIFQQVPGVKSVVSGYSGGTVKDPTYRQVCTGTTGHAEVIHLTYDPAVVSYPELLKVFWQTHDPTTLNRQGHDVGTQYRSAIFYHDDEQRRLAEEYKRKLTEAGAFNQPIVTEITRFTKFYPAEAYHQNYYRDHPNEAYCRIVIVPKLEKFNKVFKR